MQYHVILTKSLLGCTCADGCGDEFSVEIEASDVADAWDTVQMDYPESVVVAVLDSRCYRAEAINRIFNDMWEN